MVLDIKMPRLDGMELLTQLRRSVQVPSIFLTSKGDEVDEVLGLKLGADDYISKPFSQRLLIERIRAVLRRAAPEGAGVGAGEETSAPPIVRGELVLDPARHLCTWRERPVALTVTRIPDPALAGGPPRPRQDPRSADGRGLRRAGLRR